MAIKMPRNQLNFFATKNDLVLLLSPIESQRSLQYVRGGLYDAPNVEVLQSLIADPKLGPVASGDPNPGDRFLLARRETVIVSREVPQRAGGVKYAFDQIGNPETVLLVPGGYCEPSFLLAGTVGTTSNAKDSLDLFGLIRVAINHHFVKIKSYHVGPEAEVLLDSGWRLTTSRKTPTAYDLRRL